MLSIVQLSVIILICIMLSFIILFGIFVEWKYAECRCTVEANDRDKHTSLLRSCINYSFES